MNIIKTIYYGIKRIFYKGKGISIEEQIYIKEAAIREIRWEIDNVRYQAGMLYYNARYLRGGIYNRIGNHYIITMARLGAKKRRLEDSLKALKKRRDKK